ncbi:MAG: hypothetical protein AAF741_05740 [Bacteroidota bacterium]
MLHYLTLSLFFVIFSMSCGQNTKIPVESSLLQATKDAFYKHIEAEEDRYEIAYQHIEEQLSFLSYEKYFFVLDLHRQLFRSRKQSEKNFWKIMSKGASIDHKMDTPYGEYQGFENVLYSNIELMTVSILDSLEKNQQLFGLSAEDFDVISQVIQADTSLMSNEVTEEAWVELSRDERSLKLLTMYSEFLEVYRGLESQLYLFCIRNPYFTESYFPLIVNQEFGCLQIGDTLKLKGSIAQYERMVDPAHVILVADGDTCKIGSDGFLIIVEFSEVLVRSKLNYGLMFLILAPKKRIQG